MRKVIFLLFLLPALQPVQAQLPPQLDSLIRTIPAMGEDTNKVNTLLTVTQMYWSVAPPEAFPYAEQALALSEKIGWKKGIANCNGVLGASWINLGDFPKALEYLHKSLQMSQELNDLNGVSRSFGTLGTVYYYQSDYPQALEYYLEAVKVCEKTGDWGAAAGSLSNIGAIYMDLEKYPEALDYFEKAKKINEETDNKLYLAANLSNMGIIYNKLNELDKSLEYYTRAMALDEETGNIPSLATGYANAGSIYLNKGDLDKALDYVKKGLRMSTEIMDKGNMGYAYSVAGQAYINILKNKNVEALNRYFAGSSSRCLQAAKTCADSSVALNSEIGALDPLKNSYQLLSEIQAFQGDHAAALVSYQQYSNLKDSIFNLEEDRKLTQTSMQYEFDKKEAAVKAEQEKKDIRQRNIRNSIAAGLLGVLIFLIVVYRQRNRIAKEKQRAEDLLLNILPEEVAKELQEKGSADAKMIDEVTVLFSDFKGFTQMSEKVSPRELVAEINECFSEFDRIMTRYGVEKIKTIGDAYMAAGGLPVPNSTHAMDVVQAALEMQQFMLNRQQQLGGPDKLVFEIRIGVHTGPVVAGIVGLKKFAYDIWGDTVNTASRMESSGESGKVNISGTTYELVKEHVVCTHRGKVQAKGKGEIDMYFVESMRVKA